MTGKRFSQRQIHNLGVDANTVEGWMSGRDLIANVHICRGLEGWKRCGEKISPTSSSTGGMASDHARGDHNSTHACWPCRVDWTSVNSMFKHPFPVGNAHQCCIQVCPFFISSNSISIPRIYSIRYPFTRWDQIPTTSWHTERKYISKCIGPDVLTMESDYVTLPITMNNFCHKSIWNVSDHFAPDSHILHFRTPADPQIALYIYLIWKSFENLGANM